MAMMHWTESENRHVGPYECAVKSEVDQVLLKVFDSPLCRAQDHMTDNPLPSVTLF